MVWLQVRAPAAEPLAGIAGTCRRIISPLAPQVGRTFNSLLSIFFCFSYFAVSLAFHSLGFALRALLKIFAPLPLPRGGEWWCVFTYMVCCVCALLVGWLCCTYHLLFDISNYIYICIYIEIVFSLFVSLSVSPPVRPCVSHLCWQGTLQATCTRASRAGRAGQPRRTRRPTRIPIAKRRRGPTTPTTTRRGRTPRTVMARRRAATAATPAPRLAATPRSRPTQVRNTLTISKSGPAPDNLAAPPRPPARIRIRILRTTIDGSHPTLLQQQQQLLYNIRTHT